MKTRPCRCGSEPAQYLRIDLDPITAYYECIKCGLRAPFVELGNFHLDDTKEKIVCLALGNWNGLMKDCIYGEDSMADDEYDENEA
jgi:hypothetical protein